MNVLYVEDNVLDVDLTRREMAKLAPEISLEIASTMREAVIILNEAAAGHFQVVLSDLRLPDGDGLAVLAHIRERGFPLAVVLVTSSGDEETAVTALKAGANDYIVKHPGYLKRLPFTLENAVQQFRALTSRSTRPLRVLYAEHNQVDVDLTRRHFARQAPHIRLDVVHDAEQIFQKTLRTPNPTCEVILLDYRLPGQTGLDILKELRANHVNFPVVIVTGQGDEEVALQAIKLGALDYVIKNPGYLYRLPYILETARDTAERAREHAALEESQSRLQALFNTALDAYLLVNDESRFLASNPAACSLLGYTHDELLSMHLSEIAADSSLENMRRLQAELLHPGKQLGEMTLRCKDGRLIYTEYHAVANIVPDVHLIVIHDITARKEAEARTQVEASRALALAQIATRLNAQLDLPTVLRVVCEETAAALGVPAVAVMLHDAQSQTLRIAQTIGLPETFIQRVGPMPVEELEPHLFGNKTVQAVSITDLALMDDLPLSPLFQATHIRSVAGVGMIRDDQIHGAIFVLTLEDPRNFSPDEIDLLRAITAQAAQAVANARLFEAIQRQLKHVQSLRRNDTAIASSTDLNVILRGIIEEAAALLEVDAVDVLLLNIHTLQLSFADGLGFRTAAWRSAEVRLGEGYAGKVALERIPLSLPEITSVGVADSRMGAFQVEKFEAYFAVPLISKGKVRGVIEALHRSPYNPDREWLDLLEALGNQAALALDNASLFESLERSNTELLLTFDRTIEGWSRALDLRDKETENHTQRVVDAALQLASAMGLSEEELIHVRRGALLHDIGKMGVPDHILNKEGPLTEEEWQIMRTHPKLAYDLISPIDFLQPALDIPYCHHEQWDGSGYPRGLVGEQIPLAARIFAVVDVWEALRSRRPYRDAWPEAKVREYIRARAGSHFDPQVADEFLKLLETHPHIGESPTG